MTFLEIQDLALSWLDDPSAGYFTRPQIRTWVNNAHREVQKLLLNSSEDYYTKCARTSTVAGQSQYQLPPDFVKLQRLSFIYDGSGDNARYQRIFPITRNEQDLVNINQTGDPQSFFFNKDTLTLVPTPNRGVVLHLDYTYRVSDMTADGDEPDVPEDYHEFLAILCARDGFLKDGRDFGPIERKLAYFEEMLKQNAEQRNQDSPRYVVATQQGFGSY